jgi:hypothetical protein
MLELRSSRPAWTTQPTLSQKGKQTKNPVEVSDTGLPTQVTKLYYLLC